MENSQATKAASGKRKGRKLAEVEFDEEKLDFVKDKLSKNSKLGKTTYCPIHKARCKCPASSKQTLRLQNYEIVQSEEDPEEIELRLKSDGRLVLATGVYGDATLRETVVEVLMENPSWLELDDNIDMPAELIDAVVEKVCISNHQERIVGVLESAVDKARKNYVETPNKRSIAFVGAPEPRWNSKKRSKKVPELSPVLEQPAEVDELSDEELEARDQRTESTLRRNPLGEAAVELLKKKLRLHNPPVRVMVPCGRAHEDCACKPSRVNLKDYKLGDEKFFGLENAKTNNPVIPTGTRGDKCIQKVMVKAMSQNRDLTTGCHQSVHRSLMEVVKKELDVIGLKKRIMELYDGALEQVQEMRSRKKAKLASPIGRRAIEQAARHSPALEDDQEEESAPAFADETESPVRPARLHHLASNETGEELDGEVAATTTVVQNQLPPPAQTAQPEVITMITGLATGVHGLIGAIGQHVQSQSETNKNVGAFICEQAETNSKIATSINEQGKINSAQMETNTQFSTTILEHSSILKEHDSEIKVAKSSLRVHGSRLEKHGTDIKDLQKSHKKLESEMDAKIDAKLMDRLKANLFSDESETPMSQTDQGEYIEKAIPVITPAVSQGRSGSTVPVTPRFSSIKRSSARSSTSNKENSEENNEFNSARQTEKSKPKLSAAERKAIANYTGSGYIEINNNLRRNQKTSSASRLATALNKCHNYRGKVYRGAKHDKEFVAKNFQVGKRYTEPGFFSTSKEHSACKRTRNTQFEIWSETGKDIESFSPRHMEEKEVLFMHGTEFTVKSVIERADGVFQIAMEEIPKCKPSDVRPIGKSSHNISHSDRGAIIINLQDEKVEKINTDLRSSKMSVEARRLEEALLNCPKYTGTVFWGSQYDSEFVKQNFREGETYTELGFIIASKRAESAGLGDVQFEISPKEDGNARSIDDVIRNNSEKEVVFKPGSKFMVSSIHGNELTPGTLKIVMEEV